RGALMIVGTQLEYGNLCPISMTYAVVPVLRRHSPEIAAEWEPRFVSTAYDARFQPASAKTGALCGMAMTEKQGGSDVRANTTRAEPAGAATGPGAEYLLTGHKWFCSAPMNDAFLTLAQTPKGLSCFFLPRWTPDGKKNRFFIQRLKDKLGNRSNASSEIEYDRTWARMVGEEGRGVPTIIEMANHTRLDCMLGSAGAMRQGVVFATHHSAHRTAFSRKLIDQPLMANVLADLAIESEAATLLAMRTARAFDREAKDEGEKRLRRTLTAVGKYWICKRTPAHAAEVVEVHGGNGFVESSGVPRLYREAPLNSVWEGSGNVMCLDVLRILAKEPGALDAFRAEVRLAAGMDRRLDAFIEKLEGEVARGEELEVGARRIVERMALALQASLLLRHSPPFVADAFCASRLGGDWGAAFGTLPASTDFKAIIDRARPDRDVAI
ncbi:MAG TPA: acyl-CoA dehydrogenase family protein, partial [Planctomycetota bacterium]|nr:acyl-CoA dehydrogenase family protein [Planctomycetota bacterium]